MSEEIKTIDQYPEMIQHQIKRAGSIEQWKKNMSERGRKGGQAGKGVSKTRTSRGDNIK